MAPPTVCCKNCGILLRINCGILSDSYGSGEPHLEDAAEISGLLHGVAVGVKLFNPLGVLIADGVTALMPKN